MNAQVLQQAGDTAQMASMQRQLVLANRMRAGIGWFYWIAGLSLVNSGAYLFGLTWTFVAGLGITQLVDAITSLLAQELGEGGAILRVVGVGIDVLIAGAFVLIGYFGRKGIRWPVIAGMILYTLDALLLLAFRDFFAAAFHGWALVGIWSGMKAMGELQHAGASIGKAEAAPQQGGSGEQQNTLEPIQPGKALDPEGRMQQLDRAYSLFVEAVNSLSPEAFLLSLGDWTPRDIVAHLIGWNRNILTGCQQIRAGVSPFYHKDGPNDYRQINAVSILRYNAKDRSLLLKELADSKEALLTYLRGLDELDWYKDYGPRHYRGGAATVARAIESLTGDYLNHTWELERGK